MATSLEARVPLLDHEIIETVARVPATLKIKGTGLRHIQKRAMRRRLPGDVFRRRKRGFGCPVGRWFRGELQEMLRDLLSHDAIANDGLFDPRAVAAILEAHVRYDEDRSEALLALLTFQIWRGHIRSSRLTRARADATEVIT